LINLNCGQNMKKSVIIGLSGGVDSAVAAALLLQKGYDVVGVTMRFDRPTPQKGVSSCGSSHGIDDARRVADILKIRHYTVNMQAQLKRQVIDDFCREYAQGRTPNPCVRCNSLLKFEMLLTQAVKHNADYIATGHYAGIQKYNGVYYLRKGKDPRKDQTYFLYRLTQRQLSRTLFPLGALTKQDVRHLAVTFRLPVAQKPGSQEICFLKGEAYQSFLRRHLRRSQYAPGPVIDTSGTVLGRHAGVAFYTIGQRQGLGIAYRYPLYIVSIDAGRNTIIVGSYHDACSSVFTVCRPHFMVRPAKKTIEVRVKIRYNHLEAPAEVLIASNTAIIRFKKPQFALTPGQSAVFYHGEKVLGGGIIDKILDSKGLFPC
jgi:tRNA-uridine 2-sulfurtransferase